MAIEDDITTALYNRARELVAPGGPLAGMPLFWPNIPARVPSGQYLRAINMIGPPERVGVSSKFMEIKGILQVSIMTPEGQGGAFPSAGKIIDHFPADLYLTEGNTRVRITDRPNLGPYLQSIPFMQSLPHWQQPINVNWSAMVAA